MDLLARVLVAAEPLLPPDGARVVVAVSGGADSMALWDLLTRPARWPLTVWHLDHGLRDDAAHDGELIRQRAEAYAREGAAPTVLIERADVAAEATARGVSLESAGRDLRYGRLRAVARSEGASVVAVAHHRDDQAETVLANLLRGAGPVGRAGMPPRRALGAGVTLVRPLLAIGRDELRAYLRERGLTWREDETNADQRFHRNFLRHAVLPSFEQGAPGFGEALAGLAEESRARVAEIAARADAVWRVSVDAQRVHLDPVRQLDVEARLLLWRRLLRRLKLPLARRHLGALDRIAVGPGGRYALGELEFQRVRGQLTWSGRVVEISDSEVVISGAGLYRRDGDIVRVDCLPPPLDARVPPDVAWLDAAQLRPPVVWRPAVRGERWRPLGSPGQQGVAKTLAERGIASRERDGFPLIADAAGVLWLPGVAMCERARITAATRDALRLTHIPDTLAPAALADYGHEP